MIQNMYIIFYTPPRLYSESTFVLFFIYFCFLFLFCLPFEIIIFLLHCM